MQKYKSNITSTSGAAIRGVPVLVIDEDGNNAALFLDRAGTVPAPNPLTTGPDGVFYFYAVNGRYSLRTTVDGVTITDDDVVLMMDPAEITVAGPIAEAVAAAQAAATAAETAVANSGIPVLVSSAQNAVVDANAALSQAIASSNSAALSKTDADAARDAAVTAKMAAEAALDSFDDRYLGAKAVAPTTDNDGGALLTGALYWDTALPGIRSWNGGAWVTLPAATAGSVSFTPAGAGAVERTAQDKLREGVSVKDFGAVGDGVTDDTAAFNAAINAADGRVVTVPTPNDNTALPADFTEALLEYNGNRAVRTTHIQSSVGTAKKVFKAQFPLAHPDTIWTALHTETQAHGSGKNGPQSADYGQIIAIHKKGYAGVTSPPAGEIDGLSILVRQDGPKGQPSSSDNSSDATGVLVNIQNVEDVGFTSAWEASTSNYNRGTASITRSVQTQIGAIDANQVGAPSYGYVAVSTAGANTTAYYAGADAGSSWDNILFSPLAVRIDRAGNYIAPTPDWSGGSWSIARQAGANGSTQITHRGTGALFLFAQDAGAIQFGTNGNIRWEINSAGNLTPASDNTVSIGGATRRCGTVFSRSLNIGTTSTNGVTYSSGTGSPEGVVNAPVGSIYTRKDGGAGTTLYVKESGTGATGWAAK